MSDETLGTLKRTTGVLTRFAIIQGVAHALGMISGFVFVRNMEKSEYALYVLTTGAISAVFSLSNSSIIEAASAIGGRVWTNKSQLAHVVASAVRVRKQIAVAAIVPIVLLQGWLLLKNGAGPTRTTLLIASAFLAANLALSSGIWRVALRLNRRLTELQAIDLLDGASRLALTVLLFRFLDALTAVAIIVVVAGIQFFATRIFAAKEITLSAEPDQLVGSEMRAVVRRQWPYELISVYRGQIVIVILALMGRTSAVAEVGALGRVTVLFAIAWSTMQSVVLPHYARCQNAAELARLYFSILAGCALLAAVPVAASLAFPTQLLSILGQGYGNLAHELALVSLSVGMAFVANISGTLNSIRAWIIPAWIMIPADLTAMIGLIAFLGVSTPMKILWAAIIADVFFLVVNFGATIWFSKGFRTVQPSRAGMDA